MVESEVRRSEDIVVGILMIAILAAMLVLIVAIVYGVMNTAYSSYTGTIYDSHSVTNETEAWINTTGYNLSAYNSSNSNFVITAIWNATDGGIGYYNLSIPIGNATVSSLGVVTNATVFSWDNVSISYTYKTDVTSDSTLSTAYSGIQNNVVVMISNFFALMPTIGTILAVVILIGVIVLLVMYVSKMRNPASSEQMFSG